MFEHLLHRYCIFYNFLLSHNPPTHPSNPTQPPTKTPFTTNFIVFRLIKFHVLLNIVPINYIRILLLTYKSTPIGIHSHRHIAGGLLMGNFNQYPSGLSISCTRPYMLANIKLKKSEICMLD